jgi:predicted ATPase
VLDNCEHVIEAAAVLAETLLTVAPSVKMLATSREKLNVSGEWTYQLPSLELPARGTVCTLDVATRYPAIDLLVQRASAASSDVVLTDRDVDGLCELCRKLDGIPLAIEFAAARLGSLGLKNLLEHVDGHLEILSRGRRTALPRHRTLRAVIDWSFGLLSEPEQKVLRRLSVFRSHFSLESAAHVATDPQFTSKQVMRALLQLIEKSLISTRVVDEVADYRLLETTRAYAAEKLGISKEAAQTLTLHARHLVNVLAQAEAEWLLMDKDAWTLRYGPIVNDVRAALDWSFAGRGGDVSTGVRLTAAALLVSHELGLLDEYHDRAELALDHLNELHPPDPAAELRLNTAVIFPGGRSEQPSRPYDAVCERNLELAAILGEPKYHVAALLGVWIHQFRDADFPGALATVDRMSEQARTAGPLGMLLTQRLLAQTKHFLGDHGTGQQLAEQVLMHAGQNMPADYISPVPTAVAMRILLARILWLRGYADQASEVAAQCVELASAHSFALTQALALAACPVAIWRGETEQARVLVNQLMRHAASLTSAYWQSCARIYDGTLGLLETETTGSSLRPFSLAITTAANQMALEHAETFAMVVPSASTVARAEGGDVGWCAAEILRLQAEALGAAGRPANEVEDKLNRALGVARDHGELSWELRCARSLAGHWRRHGRVRLGHELLKATLDRFTEGFQTRDLMEAKRELESLT